MTLIWAVTRLLPLHWQLRNRAVNQRTWPAIAITLIFIVYWFGTFAFPYRQPVITDGIHPELSILHVEKDGITFHETRISLYRDGRYQLVRNDRQLFHYSFVETAHEGLLTEDLCAKLKAIEALPELKRTLDKAPRALQARHGEGWYTEMGLCYHCLHYGERYASPSGFTGLSSRARRSSYDRPRFAVRGQGWFSGIFL